jgi:hypothetical protein
LAGLIAITGLIFLLRHSSLQSPSSIVYDLLPGKISLKITDHDTSQKALIDDLSTNDNPDYLSSIVLPLKRDQSGNIPRANMFGIQAEVEYHP